MKSTSSTIAAAAVCGALLLVPHGSPAQTRPARPAMTVYKTPT